MGFVAFIYLFLIAVECKHAIILLKMVSCKWDLGQWIWLWFILHNTDLGGIKWWI